MKVYLIGVGMGSRELLTRQAEQAIQKSELLVGAERLLDEFADMDAEKLPLVLSKDIAQAIDHFCGERVAVLFSGDIGFFSGAKNLYPFLSDYDVVSIPGISSLSYFSSRCAKLWQDAYVISCHGRDGGIVSAVQSHAKVFILTGGSGYKVQQLCSQLQEVGLGHLSAWAGERLSYPEERIVSGTVEQLSYESFDDLAVLLVENPSPVQPVFQAPGLPDDAFLRGKVPMTKEEVRVLAVSNLHLCSQDVVWDVGAGTGSVSVECALCLPQGQVYAIEQKPEAWLLIQKNKEKFGVTNLHLVCGEAPKALEELPAPDAVFIGGSSGKLSEIVGVALDKNPAVRIVVAAITLETLSAALEVIRSYGFQETDIIQVSISRSHSVASYHMMRSENPIYLISMEDPL